MVKSFRQLQEIKKERKTSTAADMRILFLAILQFSGSTHNFPRRESRCTKPFKLCYFRSRKKIARGGTRPCEE